MAYQPTLFLPYEVIEKINHVVDPLEKLFHQIANSTGVAEQTKLHARTNLNQFAQFRKKQQEILDTFANTDSSSSKCKG
jgi:hypothetical protein